MNDFGFVMSQEEITVDYAPGESKEVELYDGSKIVLKKVDDSHDPTDKQAALRLLTEAHDKQQFITGLLYVNGERQNLSETFLLGDTPLSHFQQDKLRPSRESLQKIMSTMY